MLIINTNPPEKINAAFGAYIFYLTFQRHQGHNDTVSFSSAELVFSGMSINFWSHFIHLGLCKVVLKE